MEPEGTVSTPSYQLPSRPKSPVRYWILGGIVAILLLVVGGIAALYMWYTPFRNRVDEVRAIISMPTDLRSAYFAGSTSSGEKVFYRIEGLQFIIDQKPDYQLPGATSPNGTKAVFAAEDVGGAKKIIGTSKPTVTLDRWVVVIGTIADGSTQEIAMGGYAPEFIDDTHIGYFTKAGYRVYDTTVGTSTLVGTFLPGITFSSRITYSPDRTLVIWTDTASHTTTVARVSSENYAPVATFAAFDQASLSNTHAYDLRKGMPASQVIQHPLDDGRASVAVLLPASLGIQLLLP